MTQAIPFIIQNNNIVLMLDNQTHNISKDTHPKYDQIVDALKRSAWDEVNELLDVCKPLRDFTDGKLDLKDGVLYWNKRELHGVITVRIIEMIKQGFSVEPLVAFLANLMDNPSFTAVNGLYEFLEVNSHPITEDGHFLAYKRVKVLPEGGYVDVHTGKMDNSVGVTLEMPRNEVDDNPASHCSSGLHFCALDYLKQSGFGGGADTMIVILKINPKDVVALPNDYNAKKGRACRYEVVGVHGQSLTENAEFAKAVSGT
jgi:hypothetical protein